MTLWLINGFFLKLLLPSWLRIELYVDLIIWYSNACIIASRFLNYTASSYIFAQLSKELAEFLCFKMVLCLKYGHRYWDKDQQGPTRTNKYRGMDQDGPVRTSKDEPGWTRMQSIEIKRSLISTAILTFSLVPNSMPRNSDSLANQS